MSEALERRIAEGILHDEMRELVDARARIEQLEAVLRDIAAFEKDPQRLVASLARLARTALREDKP